MVVILKSWTASAVGGELASGGGRERPGRCSGPLMTFDRIPTGQRLEGVHQSGRGLDKAGGGGGGTTHGQECRGNKGLDKTDAGSTTGSIAVGKGRVRLGAHPGRDPPFPALAIISFPNHDTVHGAFPMNDATSPPPDSRENVPRHGAISPKFSAR